MTHSNTAAPWPHALLGRGTYERPRDCIDPPVLHDEVRAWCDENTPGYHTMWGTALAPFGTGADVAESFGYARITFVNPVIVFTEERHAVHYLLRWGDA